MSQPLKPRKALILVFEHDKNTKTNLGKNIQHSIELDFSATRDDKTEFTAKNTLKSFRCVILTTKEKKEDKLNIRNILQKHCKLKNILYREIKIAED